MESAIAEHGESCSLQEGTGGAKRRSSVKTVPPILSDDNYSMCEDFTSHALIFMHSSICTIYFTWLVLIFFSSNKHCWEFACVHVNYPAEITMCSHVLQGR